MQFFLPSQNEPNSIFRHKPQLVNKMNTTLPLIFLVRRISPFVWKDPFFISIHAEWDGNLTTLFAPTATEDIFLEIIPEARKSPILLTYLGKSRGAGVTVNISFFRNAIFLVFLHVKVMTWGHLTCWFLNFRSFDCWSYDLWASW